MCCTSNIFIKCHLNDGGDACQEADIPRSCAGNSRWEIRADETSARKKLMDCEKNNRAYHGRCGGYVDVLFFAEFYRCAGIFFRGKESFY